MATKNNSANNSCLAGILVSGGTVDMNSGTSAVGISTDNVDTTISIGTGGGIKTITLGSTTSSSTTTVTSGSGGVQLPTFINLPTTTSTNGQLRINNTRFVHGYGTENTYVGPLAGNFTLTGSNNVAVGSSAGTSATSSVGNTAIGRASLGQATSGGSNTAIGNGSLGSLTTGTNNIAIGASAGGNLTSSEDSNIYLNFVGTTGESHSLKIGAGTGTGSQQLNTAYISGVRGITTGNNNAVAVLVDSSNQFGTVSSSIRYKENVEDMADVSSGLLKLRPVIYDLIGKHYQYKQVGLIAEEVNDILPQLVATGAQGEIESVKYHDLPVLLLNELQKALKRIEALEEKLKG